MTDNRIIIVSGLPRSGTSMIMQMLHAGGVPLLTDGVRKPDKANPRGYFEYERLKKLEDNPEIIGEATGKAVKVISHLLQYLPQEHQYKIIFIERDIDEILQSQEKMLQHLDEPGNSNRDHFRTIYLKHIREVKHQLSYRKEAETLFLQHHQVITDPGKAAADIEQFLGSEINQHAMADVVDQELYRNRKAQK